MLTEEDFFLKVCVEDLPRMGDNASANEVFFAVKLRDEVTGDQLLGTAVDFTAINDDFCTTEGLADGEILPFFAIIGELLGESAEATCVVCLKCV